MSRKRHAHRPSRPAAGASDSNSGSGSAAAEPTGSSGEDRAADSVAGDTTDPGPASMRDAMRAALDAKASRQARAPGGGPRPGSDGAAGRGGGAKGFRALPRRSAG